jgi:DNA-directed RNA polymerase specialized sigma24 family protein
MARNKVTPPESFNEILAWLNPDREVAAEMYVQLRSDLTRIFIWRRCSDPEGMTDEVFERVARKVAEVRPTYEGDPRRYFHAVANILIKENLKKIKTHVPLEDVDLSNRQATENENEEKVIALEECLQACLQELETGKRELLKAYYAEQKQAKIDHRFKLAEDLKISLPALRVKVFRIRGHLEECIRRCLLNRKSQSK